MALLIDFMNENLVYASTLLFLFGFLIWEIPRTLKIMNEEYTSGVYPEMGRIFDIIIFIIGLAAGLFFYSRLNDVIETMKMPTFSLAFTVILIAVPLLVLLGFLSRTAKRINEQKSVSVFLTHELLDLAHVVFFIGFSGILIPVIIFFVVDFVF